MTGNKGHYSSEAMTKKVQFFGIKNWVTPSAAAPGDTNPSDATGGQLGLRLANSESL